VPPPGGTGAPGDFRPAPFMPVPGPLGPSATPSVG
jgi:hypothetical protein